ncbi:MAG: Fic family protein [Myxococcota bacterium]|jgi:Fic family protein|nr:Fic family protein [Myxococcota bacterium]
MQQLTLLNLDLKNAQFKNTLRRTPAEQLRQWQEHVRMSWVYLDHALEGVVLSEAEFVRGIGNEAGKDCCEQALLDSVSRLYGAFEQVSDAASLKQPIALETLKWVHVLCAPSDENAGRYRKVEAPLGAYMQNCAPVKAISYRLRKLVELIESELSSLHPIQAATLVHYEFMSIFPFDKLTGRAGRLLLSYWLMREGYPALLVPATMRADYYNALCSDGAGDLLEVVSRAMEHSLELGLRMLGQREQRRRAA